MPTSKKNKDEVKSGEFAPVGRVIRMLREKQNVTNDELADRCGLRPDHLWRI